MVLPRFLPSFIRFHRVFISSYWISLGSTSSYQALPSSLGFTSSFTVIISFHWISRSSFLPIFTRCTIYFSLHYLVSLWFSFWVAKWLRCFLFQFLERNGQRCCLFVLFWRRRRRGRSGDDPQLGAAPPGQRRRANAPSTHRLHPQQGTPNIVFVVAVVAVVDVVVVVLVVAVVTPVFGSCNGIPQIPVNTGSSIVVM